MDTDNQVGAWDKGQVLAFARQIFLDHADAWSYLGPKLRNGLLDSFIVNLILGARTPISIDEIRLLRLQLRTALAEKHRMKFGDEE